MRDEDCGTRSPSTCLCSTRTASRTTTSMGRFGAEVRPRRTRAARGRAAGHPSSGGRVAEATATTEGQLPVRSVLKCEAEGSASTATAWRPATGKGARSRRGGHHRRAVDPSRARSSRCGRSTPAGWPGPTSRTASRAWWSCSRHASRRAWPSSPRWTVPSRSRGPRRRSGSIDHRGRRGARNAFPRRTRLFVEKGQKVEAGNQLNEGSGYPHELLRRTGHPRGAPRPRTTSSRRSRRSTSPRASTSTTSTSRSSSGR